MAKSPSRVLVLPGTVAEAEQACKEAARDAVLRPADASLQRLVFRDPYGWFLYHLHVGVDLEAAPGGVRVGISTSATGAVIPTTVRYVERLVDLFIRLIERSPLCGESEDGEWMRLRRRTRTVIRLIPLFRWVPAALLLVFGTVLSVFSGGRPDPFIVWAIIWGVSGGRWAVDMVRRRLSGASRRRFWLRTAAEWTAVVALFVISFLLL